MKAKQVFRTYNLNTINTKTPEDNNKYCPSCGTEGILKQDNGILRMTCPACEYIQYSNPVPAVSVLVTDNSEFLLCRRGSVNFQRGKWCLPCGFIEFNEDYLTAAIREVKEETGLDVEIRSIISVVSNFFTPDLHTLVVVLLARPIGGDLSIGDAENDKLQWYSIEEKLPEMAFEADTHIIRRYFETHVVGAPVDLDYSKQVTK